MPETADKTTNHPNSSVATDLARTVRQRGGGGAVVERVAKRFKVRA